MSELSNERVSDERLAEMLGSFHRVDQNVFNLDVIKSLTELQQRRASVVTPEMEDLVHRLNVAADGVETVSFDRLSLRRGYENLLREAAVALSVSHETGCGDRGGELRKIISDARENTMARPAGRRGPFIIPDAPTDKTQGVKREVWVEELYEAVEELQQAAKMHTGPMEALFSDAVDLLLRLNSENREVLSDYRRQHKRAETAEASLAAANQIVGQVEERFPNWPSYRDLVDCIDATLAG